MQNSIMEFRKSLGFNPLGLKLARHRFHGFGSRSPEKREALAFAIEDKLDRNLSEGKFQPIAEGYGFIRIGSKESTRDPKDFRRSWQENWEAPLNRAQKAALVSLEKILREKPAELQWDKDGAVNVKELICFINQKSLPPINKFCMDKLVFGLSPRRFIYRQNKSRIGLIKDGDIRKISAEESSPPPNVLYYAVKKDGKVLRDIDREGIYPVDAQLVTLYGSVTDAKTALVSEDDIFIYQADAKRMDAQGYLFKKGTKCWLTGSIPLQYLSYYQK